MTETIAEKWDATFAKLGRSAPAQRADEATVDYQRRLARVGRKYIPAAEEIARVQLRPHHGRRCGAEVLGNDARSGRAQLVSHRQHATWRNAPGAGNGPQHWGEDPQLDRPDIIRQRDGPAMSPGDAHQRAQLARRSTPLTVAPWGRSSDEYAGPDHPRLAGAPDAASNKRVNRPEPASPPPQRHGQWPLNQPHTGRRAPPPRRGAARDRQQLGPRLSVSCGVARFNGAAWRSDAVIRRPQTLVGGVLRAVAGGLTPPTAPTAPYERLF